MSILLFLNLKGGVAKTTNAIAVAECLAEAGRRVLVIDADHQRMAGELLLGVERARECDDRRRTLHDLMAAMLDDDFDVRRTSRYVVENVSDIGGGLPTLSVLPCSFRINDFSTNRARAGEGYRSNDDFLSFYDRRRHSLQRWLRENYDFTIVDCPPSLALQVRFFLKIADGYIIPAVPDRMSVRGAMTLTDRLRGRTARPLGTLWSLYREQVNMHRRVVEEAAAGLDDYVSLPRPFATAIPNATAIADASEPNRRPSSFTAKYEAKFARLYRSLCDEIVGRTESEVVDRATARASSDLEPACVG